jgi:hypothetical protein
MSWNLRWLLTAMAATAGLGLLLYSKDVEAQGDKGSWQQFMPKDVYQELAKREAEIVKESLANDPKVYAINRAKLGAVLIAAYTMSVKDGADAKQLGDARGSAIQLANVLKKGDLAEAKKLAAELPKGQSNAKADNVNWGGLLEPADLMDHLNIKSKGGDGIHPDLHANARYKTVLNGVEMKIGELAKKELAEAVLKKEAKELELLGYRCAVVGELTYNYAPTAKADKKDPQEWRKLSLQMRDQSVSLAQAAKKLDAAGVLKASSDLNSTCTQCHSVFK